MNKPMSDSEKAKLQIRHLINKFKFTRDKIDAEYYHYTKSKIIGTINFCKVSELITEEEANIFMNEVLRF